jgi:hypothetical protein
VRGTPTNLNPEDLAARDQAMAETRTDLENLLKFAGEKLPEMGTDALADTLIRGFLGQPEWDDLALATVLGMAVVRLAIAEAGGAA